MSAHEPIQSPSNAPEGPSSPLELGAGDWKGTLKRVRLKLVEDRVSLSAGSLAYHWFLAFFPAVIALIGIVSAIKLSGAGLTHLTHGIAKALPPGVAGVFNAAVTEATKRSGGSAIAVAVGIVVALWSASAGMSALQQALDVAYEVPEDRKFLARRVRAVPLMVATAVLGGIGAALIVFGAPIGSAIQGFIPIHGIAFDVVWTVVRWVTTILAVTTLFSAYYFLAPNRTSPSWQWISAGGLLASAVFLLASLGFSFYVTKFGSYGKTYGSFAGVAVLIFWLYLTGFAVLLGGEINAELERAASAAARDERELRLVDR